MPNSATVPMYSAPATILTGLRAAAMVQAPRHSPARRLRGTETDAAHHRHPVHDRGRPGDLDAAVGGYVQGRVGQSAPAGVAADPRGRAWGPDPGRACGGPFGRSGGNGAAGRDVLRRRRGRLT